MVSYEEAEGADSVLLSQEFTSSALVDALHNSPFRSAHAARCFLGTHVQAKYDLSRWLATYSPRNHRDGRQDSQRRFNLLWLHGAAGTGKTTLMQTLADALLPPTTSVSASDDIPAEPPSYESDEFGSIGVQYGGTAVFLSKEHQLADVSKVFTTIALGLAGRVPPLAAFVQSAFDANKDAFWHNTFSLEKQAEILIFNPVQEWVTAEEGEVDVDLIIIVDGIDECDDKKMQREIIEIVRDIFTQKIGGVRWYWVFSSRTEMRLREVLMGKSSTLSPKADEIVVGLASDAEMDAFLDCGLAKIRAMHDIGFVPVDDSTSIEMVTSSSLLGTQEEWPSPNDKTAIKWQAAGLYAAAASILQYIGKPDDDPRARIVLIDSFIGNKDPGVDHPFAKLDMLYRNILATVPATSVSTTRRVLGTISCLQPSTHKQKLPTLSLVSDLLGIPAEEVHQALYDLHSVVTAPYKRLSRDSAFSSQCAYLPYGDGKLTFRHPSFDQFLRTPARSLDWSLNLESVHMDLARCCLKRLGFGDTISEFARERWYIDCWRTGKDTEAALGILPDLFEFDFTFLPDNSNVDRYFMEWLLHLQETTMSEYQLLNPGPLIKLRTPRWSISNDPSYHSDNNQPSASTSSGANSTSRNEGKKRTYPPRRSYILGFEPPKRVYLVPYFDEKVQARTDIGLVIGPGLKHWDWIRGFKVVSLDKAEVGMETDGEDGASQAPRKDMEDLLAEAGFH